MHLSQWLLYIGSLSTGVSAFYPVDFPKSTVPGRPGSDRRRFYPVKLPKFPIEDGAKALTLDLVKAPKKVGLIYKVFLSVTN